MAFTIEFITLFYQYLSYVAPLLGVLLSIIILLGQWIGRIESWSWFDSAYWSFITALTIGYGDMRPSKRVSKVVSIIIGMLGIIFTGLIVAVAVATAKDAFSSLYGVIQT